MTTRYDTIDFNIRVITAKRFSRSDTKDIDTIGLFCGYPQTAKINGYRLLFSVTLILFSHSHNKELHKIRLTFLPIMKCSHAWAPSVYILWNILKRPFSHLKMADCCLLSSRLSKLAVTWKRENRHKASPIAVQLGLLLLLVMKSDQI